jgi:gamma-F420-2:alpha-L-glutamate ligase
MTKLWIIRNDGKKSHGVKRLVEEAKAAGITCTLLTPEQITVLVDRNDKKSIIVDGKSMDRPDVVLSRTGAATTYFNLAILRQFERCGIPVVNNSLSIEKCKDKLHTHQILSQHNLAIPKTMLIKHPVDVSLVAKKIGFPCIVKVISGSQGKGVYLSQRADSFVDLMELIHSISKDANLLIQEYVDTKVGQDLRVLMIGGQCMGAMLRTNSSGGFKANVSAGGTGSKFEITDEIELIARQTSQILGLDIAGIDLLFDKDGFKVCEANSNPGFEGFEPACKINVAREIIAYCIKRAEFKKQ